MALEDEPLNGVDLYGLCTLRLGFGGGGGFSFLTGLIGAGIAIASQGNSGVYFYVEAERRWGLMLKEGSSLARFFCIQRTRLCTIC